MRLRIRFTKLGKVRFTSHRDIARIWERALRRAQLPVARTQGFNPRPKLHYGLALPTGSESLAEYLDVDLVEGAEIDLAPLVDLLTASLPAGITATAVALVEPGGLSLQHAVESSRWEIEVLGLDPTTVTARAAALLAAPELVMVRQRKGHDVTDDVRPHLRTLDTVGPCPGGTLLIAELGAQNRGLRPSELVTLLGEEASPGRIRRTHQFTEHDGTQAEPLLPSDVATPPPGTVAVEGAVAAPPPAPHALERVS